MKSFIFVILILFTLSFIQSAENPVMVVQGFYWKGQGQYTHAQRRDLLSQLPKNSIYLYIPQVVHTLTPWSATQLTQWKQTLSFCNSQSITLILGLRPLSIQNITHTFSRIQTKVNQLHIPFALGWDDCPGGLTQEQKVLQFQLVQLLGEKGYKPWGIVPAAYYAQDGKIQTWMKGLEWIDKIDEDVPFILASKNGINPSTFDPDLDFPPLKRKMIFWDNWMAVDSLTRFPRNLPRNRSIKLFNSSYPFGYVLNLCFPPQRIFHGIQSILYQQKKLLYNYAQISHQWTTYLIIHKFIQELDRKTMEDSLKQLIEKYDGTMDVKKIVEMYPILGKFLGTASQKAKAEEIGTKIQTQEVIQQLQ